MGRFKFDGVRLEVRKRDDSDAQSYQHQGITPVMQPTELGETIKEINNDAIDPSTRMSAIDLKSRINVWERNSCVAIDWLVANKMMPRSSLMLTQQLKRLNVSLNGKGRNEIVEIVVGKREHDKQSNQMGIVDRTKQLMGIGPKT